MRRAFALAVVGCALAPAAHAQTTVVLPSVRNPGAPSVPPLPARVQTITERRWPNRIDATERVVVDVDGAGRPLRVRVVQRLVVNGLGDYTFVVPAPVVDVHRAAGSQSDPGLRRDAVVWAGFSPKRRVLAAELELRGGKEVFGALPLRVELKREAGSIQLVLVNATTYRADTFTAPVSRAAVAGELAATRRDLRLGRGMPDRYLDLAAPPRPATALVAAPLRVEGEVRAGDAVVVRFAQMLGDERPLRIALRAPARPGPLRVRLGVVPVLPQRLLAGAPTLARLVRARLAIARALQYDTFVATPDPNGSAKATYAYRTAAQTQAAPAAPADGGGRVHAAVWIALAALGAAGLAIAWAHS